MSQPLGGPPDRMTLHESYFLRLARIPPLASRARVIRAMRRILRAAAVGNLDARSLDQATIGYERLLARFCAPADRDIAQSNSRPVGGRAGIRFDALATGRVLDDRAGGYVTVALTPDGSLHCERADLLRHADEIHDGVRRGHPHDGRGVAELAALIRALPSLWSGRWGCLRTADLGPWRSLYIRYETHTVFEAAVRRCAAATRDPRRQRALEVLASCRYGRSRRLTMQHTLIGLDMPLAEIDGASVALYREDLWEVPLAADWDVSVHARGLAAVAGRFVCARAADNARIVHVIIDDRRRGFVVAAREYDRETDTLHVPGGRRHE